MSDTSELAIELRDATPPWLLSHLREWISGAGDKGHAYLVVSEDANEACLFAGQLAMRQLCHDPQEGLACGQCRSCKAFLQGTHGDLLLLQVPDGKTAIGIDQVREAAHFLQQTALYGAAKLLLVRDADQMTLAAANSLLKTLEEPPGNALMLLSSAEAWRLPPTVRSRCQLLRLPRSEKDSYLVRIFSWYVILAESGVINAMLGYVGLGPYIMLNTKFGTIIGYMTLTLPLVIILQTLSLANIDRSLVEAAHNLGCRPWRTIFRIVLPLARTGLIIAAVFCFILSFGDFVSPYYLGGSKPPTLPILIIDTGKSGQHWPRAAVVAVVMMVTLFIVAFGGIAAAYRRRVR